MGKKDMAFVVKYKNEHIGGKTEPRLSMYLNGGLSSSYTNEAIAKLAVENNLTTIETTFKVIQEFYIESKVFNGTFAISEEE